MKPRWVVVPHRGKRESANVDFKGEVTKFGFTNGFSAWPHGRLHVHARETPRSHGQTMHNDDVAVRDVEELLPVVYCS
jgi:hypothetical protein